jgi:hypothetical protein
MERSDAEAHVGRAAVEQLSDCPCLGRRPPVTDGSILLLQKTGVTLFEVTRTVLPQRRLSE